MKRREVVTTSVVLAVAAGAVAWWVRGGEIALARPWALACAAAGLVLVGWARLSRGRARAAALPFSRGADLRGASAGWRVRLAALPDALRAGAIALAGLALARPQAPADPRSVKVQGIDVMVVLDLSRSMQEHDLFPDRLAAAKEVIEDFVARRPNDRVGLVVFGREAFTWCPLTLDHRALGSLLGGVRHGLIDGRGTAIGNALGTALARLRRSRAGSKVVVLVTDGDSNAGNLSPLEAARIARELGVRVFTVLVGRTDAGGIESLIPGLARRYPVNPALLEKIAAETGGSPYLAADTGALRDRFHRILAELRRSELEDVAVVRGEAWPAPLSAALALIGLDVALAATWLRRVP